MPELPRVLIIDDDEDLGEILADYLEGSFASTVCSDPQLASTLLREHGFELILSDLHMPVVNGFAIIALAKAQEPPIPVILLTGSSAHDPDVLEAFAQGAKGIITKPFPTPETVLNYLRQFIASR